LYKINIIEGDSTILSRSKKYPEKNTNFLLRSLPLKYEHFSRREDTILFHFSFGHDFLPSRHSPYLNIAIIPNKSWYGVNFYDRGGFSLEKKANNEEENVDFLKSMIKSEDVLAPWLRCEVERKRKILGLPNQ
jgi:hypothetical protein